MSKNLYMPALIFIIPFALVTSGCDNGEDKVVRVKQAAEMCLDAFGEKTGFFHPDSAYVKSHNADTDYSTWHITVSYRVKNIFGKYTKDDVMFSCIFDSSSNTVRDVSKIK
ncbi:MAG: hypothetical protein ACI8WB_000167 [Phenylobacterium sp.]|jgi:hypothetical protein